METSKEKNKNRTFILLFYSGGGLYFFWALPKLHQDQRFHH